MDKQEIKRRCKGRKPDQQKVIRYFVEGGGCLSSGMKDEEYDAMVQAIARGTDWRKKALDKVGVDESQVKEIEPVHFEGYRFDEGGNYYARKGKDGLWRSSKYQMTWLFFSSTQVYVWQYTFNMDEDGRKERTEEYFYKDITNFSTSSDTVEKPDVLEKVNCKGDATFGRVNIETSEFTIVVPGDKFRCAMKQSDDAERAVQGMKAKLREKKNG